MNSIILFLLCDQKYLKINDLINMRLVSKECNYNINYLNKKLNANKLKNLLIHKLGMNLFYLEDLMYYDDIFLNMKFIGHNIFYDYYSIDNDIIDKKDRLNALYNDKFCSCNNYGIYQKYQNFMKIKSSDTLKSLLNYNIVKINIKHLY